MRKKLLALIKEVTPYWAEVLTDYLIKNGAIIPVRCKDCKYSRTPGNTAIRYGLPGTLTCVNPDSPCHYRHVLGDGYCPYGGKKEHD